jgi:small-conductance mechanosensitive channel
MIEIPQWVTQWLAVGWVRAVLIALASLLVAKITEWIFSKLLARLARRTTSRVDDDLIAATHRPIFLSVLFVGLLQALAQTQVPPDALNMTGRILKTLLVVIWLAASFKLCRLMLDVLVTRKDGSKGLIDARVVPLLDNMGRIVLAGLAAYFVFVIWAIDLTAWLPSAGIIGIAIGFAAKDTLGNLFSGIFILIDTPYKVGDYIVLDGGERGQVTQIGIRSTRMLTRDDVEVIIPNSIIGGAKIVNESGGPWPKFRVRVKVGVAYGSDIDLVRSVLEEIAENAEKVCDEPEPRVRFREFGDSSLDFELLCWVEEPAMRGLVLDALNTEIYKRFAAEGITIPFPQRDLHIINK